MRCCDAPEIRGGRIERGFVVALAPGEKALAARLEWMPVAT
jgi:hypothetical protein